MRTGHYWRSDNPMDQNNIDGQSADDITLIRDIPELIRDARMVLSGLYLVAHPSSEAALNPTRDLSSLLLSSSHLSLYHLTSPHTNNIAGNSADDTLIHDMPELVCDALLLMGGMYYVAQHAEAAQQNTSRYKVISSLTFEVPVWE